MRFVLYYSDFSFPYPTIMGESAASLFGEPQVSWIEQNRLRRGFRHFRLIGIFLRMDVLLWLVPIRVNEMDLAQA